MREGQRKGRDRGRGERGKQEKIWQGARWDAVKCMSEGQRKVGEGNREVGG